MKKLLCFGWLLMGAVTTALSQENFIELVVRDTTALQPKAWVYNVSLVADYETTSVYTDTASFALPSSPPLIEKNKAAQGPKGTTIEQVTALAKRHNGGLDPDDGENLNVTKRYEYDGQSANYVFTDLQSLKNFVQALAALKDVEGRIEALIPAEAQGAMTGLDSRIVATAKKRAENLAAASGRRLGEVLLITEDYGNGVSYVQPLLEGVIRYQVLGKNSRRWSLLYDNVVITRSLKVRFALR